MAAKTATINLKVKELIFDVRNKAFLTGQSREADGTANFEAASSIKASDDDDNIYQIKRSIATAFGSLKNIVGEYLNESGTTASNLLSEAIDDEDKDLTLALNMPGNFNPSAVEAISTNAHAYIVDLALADWFTITAPTMAEGYVAHSTVCVDTIKRSLHKRSRPEKPTYTA